MATNRKAGAKAPAAGRKQAAAPKAPATGARSGAPKPAAPAGKADGTAKAAKAPKARKPAKAEKPRKPKLVRDSFTIPKDEYAVLDAMKERAARLGRPTKKSEVLRAGLQALAALPDAAFLARVGAVPTIKTGRPAKA